MSNETNARTLWKKFEARYEKKTTVNKIVLIRKLANMKFKERCKIEDHINESQSIVNELAAMKMILEDEI